MVAQRDAPVVGQGDHIGEVSDGSDDRCFKPQLRRLVATLRPLDGGNPLATPAKLNRRGPRLLATIRGGHEQRCSRALWRQADDQGWPRTSATE